MRPVLFYDAESQLNRARVARWNRMTIHEVMYVPYDDSHGILPETFGAPPKPSEDTAFHLVEEDGKIYTNGDAVARLWKYTPREYWKYDLIQRVSGWKAAHDVWYARTAKQRLHFDRLHWIFNGLDEDAPTYYATRWMFLRMMGLIYAIAFASFWWQAMALIGSEGVAPATYFAEGMRSALDFEDNPIVAFMQFPTVFLIASNDMAIHVVCGIGLMGGVWLMIGFVPQLAALACWLSYLSVLLVSQKFLGYQWDTLLLEVGFLTIFFAPLALFPRGEQDSVPSTAILWLLRILCARLMWTSGLSKLGGPTWMDLSALSYHFETQPIPHFLSWHVHHFPGDVLSIFVVIMFIIELVLPLFVVAPRRLRAFAGRGFILLMILIMATGNYGFFNLLTIALAVTLFDDAHAKKWFASTAFARVTAPQVRKLPPWPRYGVVALVIIATVPLQAYYLGFRIAPPIVRPLQGYVHALYPWHLASSYGLFARMTTTRPEIIIEGSNDGTNWEPYEFQFKPGALDQAPRWAQPHMPRIDWQLWFEALHAERGGGPEPWFQNLCVALMRGDESVLAQIRENPFEGKPPRYIRARLFQYQFSSREELNEKDLWWTREEVGTYLSPVELSEAP